MKTYFKSILSIAVAVLFVSTNALAASDFLLEIEGTKGEAKGKKFTLTENTDGSFTAENIPGGTYKVVYKPKGSTTGTIRQGQPITLTFEGVISPRDQASGQSSGKRTSVQSPRDVATGQSSGKRQHKPITITKEWNPSTPTLILGQIVVGDLDGDGASDRTPGDPIPGLDVKAAKGTSTDAPVKAGYDLKLNKKV